MALPRARQGSVDTGVGTAQAWHLVRTPRPGSYGQPLDIRPGPALERYPVKLRHTGTGGDYPDPNLSAVDAVQPE